MRDSLGMYRDYFDPMQVYRNRNHVALSKQAASLLIEAKALASATCGCLDALDSLPAGGMHSSIYRDGCTSSIVPTYFYRHDLEDDIGPAERRARAELSRKLIAEILAEEKA